jgi:hypothetical protein
MLLLILLAAPAAAQSTQYSIPSENEIEQLPDFDAELQLGEIAFRAYPGYRDELDDVAYAFPMGNAALGRDWAGTGPLQWQLAYGYSVVPVLVKIKHRYPSAQHVRVEVLSAHPYAREELLSYAGPDTPEDLSRQLAIFSGEMLVPPSVPTDFVITPRYVPEAQPGTSVHMKVLLYFNHSLKPSWSQDLDVVVMDPAHLYFLNLDGPLEPPEELSINARNELDLKYDGKNRLDPSILTSMLYGIPIKRAVFTGAPLAARDFAFVTADAEQLAGWPEEEQLALETFMLAGGRLCLYNMQQPWREFDNADTPVGRGFLLAVAGPYEDARQAMQGWVEGELEEFTLLTGGSVRGRFANSSKGNPLFGNFGLRLEQVYGSDELTGIIPARRPGFLHPVWLSRELSSDNAVEPWDFPEYQLRQPRSSGVQRAGMALSSGIANTRPAELALLDAVVPRRPYPLLLLATLGCMLAAMLMLARIRRRHLLPGILACMLLSLLPWMLLTPLQYRPVSLLLLDRDLRSQSAGSRSLNVLLSHSNGNSSLEMPADALIRRVVWTPPGSFYQDRLRGASEFTGRGEAQSVNLYVDAAVSPAPQFPVGIEMQNRAGRISLKLDTSGLPAGQFCLLQSALGYQTIAGGQPSVTLQLNPGPLPVRPGLERIEAIRAMHVGGPGQGEDPSLTLFGSMLASLQRSLSTEQPGSLAQICWSGLLRQPTGLLGANRNQLVLVVVDPDLNGTDAGIQEITVQRMCIPIGDGR